MADPERSAGEDEIVSGRPPRPHRWTVISVVVLLAAAGVWFVLRDTRAEPESGRLWAASLRQPAVGRAKVFGLWTTSSALLEVDNSRVQAFDRATGADAWGFAPPSGYDRFCGSRLGSSQEILYVVHGTGTACTGVTALDTRNGTRVWSTDLWDGRDIARADTVLAQVGDVVVAASTGQGARRPAAEGRIVVGLGSGDGAEKWRREFPGLCRPVDAAPGRRQLILVVSCPVGESAGDALHGTAVMGVDPATGERTWVAQVTADDGVVNLHAGSPVVVATGLAVHAFSDDGRRLSEIPVAGFSADQMPPAYDGGPFGAHADDLLVAADTLIVQSEDHGALGPDGRWVSGIIAYDLRTGRRRWRTDASVPLRPVRIDGDTVIAAGFGSEDDPAARLYRFALDTGTKTGVVAYRVDAGTVSAEYQYLVWRDETLIAVEGLGASPPAIVAMGRP